jgi:hypothetical protein
MFAAHWNVPTEFLCPAVLAVLNVIVISVMGFIARGLDSIASGWTTPVTILSGSQLKPR